MTSVLFISFVTIWIHLLTLKNISPTSWKLIERNNPSNFFLVELEDTLDNNKAVVNDTTDVTIVGDDYKYKFADLFWIEAENKEREKKKKAKKEKKKKKKRKRKKKYFRNLSLKRKRKKKKHKKRKKKRNRKRTH